ncbi:MAG: hypothetical protein AAFV53_24880 [Myxococcota bacterium]
MSWDQTWQVNKKRLRVSDLEPLVDKIVAEYQRVEGRVEEEASDCITVFFTVPTEEEDVRATLEVSFYEMSRGSYVLSVEADASDNNAHWDDAATLAEDLADAMGAHPLEL